MIAAIVLAVVALVADGIAYAAERHRERQRARLKVFAASHGLQSDLDAKPPPPTDMLEWAQSVRGQLPVVLTVLYGRP